MYRNSLFLAVGSDRLFNIGVILVVPGIVLFYFVHPSFPLHLCCRRTGSILKVRLEPDNKLRSTIGDKSISSREQRREAQQGPSKVHLAPASEQNVCSAVILVVLANVQQFLADRDQEQRSVRDQGRHDRGAVQIETVLGLVEQSCSAECAQGNRGDLGAYFSVDIQKLEEGR